MYSKVGSFGKEFRLTFYIMSNIMVQGTLAGVMARKSRIDTYTSPLGPLEQEVMDALWTSGEASGRDIFSGIKAGRDVALTTVLTVLERLAKKGLVEKHKGVGLIKYAPALSREDFARSVSQDVFKGILGISASGLCASFVDALADADPDELERLSKLIENKKKELGSPEGKK